MRPSWGFLDNGCAGSIAAGRQASDFADEFRLIEQFVWVTGRACVYLLQHLHILNDDEEDVKVLGIYATREAAVAAVERYRRLPGFLDLPQFADHEDGGSPEGFSIDEYELDLDYWQDGYVCMS